MATYLNDITTSIGEIYSDFYENFPNTDSISSIVASIHDLYDQVATAVARAQPGVGLAGC